LTAIGAITRRRRYAWLAGEGYVTVTERSRAGPPSNFYDARRRRLPDRWVRLQPFITRAAWARGVGRSRRTGCRGTVAGAPLMSSRTGLGTLDARSAPPCWCWPGVICSYGP